MPEKRFERKTIIQIIGAVCLGLLVICTSVGTTSASSDKAKIKCDENMLKVGVSTNAPPIVYKQGEEITGLEPELAQEFGKFLGKSVQFVELEWKDQIPALLENRIDIIMSGMSVTKMREIRIAFSEPYFRTGQMALTAKAVNRNIPKNFYAMQGMSIILRFGVVSGTTGEAFVRKNFGSAKEIIAYKTSKIAVEKMLDGKIDLLIHDAPIILMLAAENEAKGLTPLPILLTEEYLAWGIRKNDVELLESANRFIAEMKKDKKLDNIIRRWIPFSE